MIKEKINAKNGKETLAIPYIVKKEDDGFIVECIDLNVVSQGDTIEEARKNIREAIILHLKSAEELGILYKEYEKLGIIKENHKIIMPKIELEQTDIEVLLY